MWDAAEIVDWSRKHTGNVQDSLDDVRRIIRDIVTKRDARKDGFAKVIANAMQSTVGNADDATKFLFKHGINRTLVKKAVAKIGDEGKPFNIFSLMDALTQLTQQLAYAGDRTEADAKVSKLLALAA